MDKFEIEGGRKLNGTVSASGSKNSALPVLFASILCPEKITLRRVPHLKDIETTLALLRGVGGHVSHQDGTAEIEMRRLASTEAPYELVRTMRASILMLGPLLARERQARVSLPGGCAIGSRPVDLHLFGLEKMGANLRLEHGYVIGACPKGLQGAEITFRVPSVGATEHMLMAACLAEGRTVIRNAAREPEIVNLANFLDRMGAKISGAGESDIEVEGVNGLRGADFEVMFDRIESATLLLAGPITGGRVRVERMDGGCLGSFLDVLRKSGADVREGPGWVEAAAGARSQGADFETEPYPGYPTDLQAQMMAYLAQAQGESRVAETIFENRFMHVPELNRLGADIHVEGANATIHGKPGCFQGAVVMATDLRASASLVLAGLAAKGKTTVRRIYHLDRGYERLETKLRHLGAEIYRSPD